MTQKIYKTARGKTVDMGALMLQNEQVRAVGNMSVNARGDLIDSAGNIIDGKNRRVQRQMQRQTVATPQEQHSSAQSIRKVEAAKSTNTPVAVAPVAPTVTDLIPGLDVAPAPVAEATEATEGLAGALVRAKKNKQPQTPTEE